MTDTPLAETTENTENAEDPARIAEEVAVAAFALAAALRRDSRPAAEIAGALTEEGLPAELSDVVVKRLFDADDEGAREEGVRNMWIGALVALGGLVFSAFSYAAATGGAPRYVILTGAIGFGALRFFRGLAQLNRS